MKKQHILRNILIDLVITGLVLTVFSLFHHVLPRQKQSLGIVISNPYQTGEENSSSFGCIILEDKMLIASAGMRSSSPQHIQTPGSIRPESKASRTPRKGLSRGEEAKASRLPNRAGNSPGGMMPSGAFSSRVSASNAGENSAIFAYISV